MSDKTIIVGRIGAPYGLKGWVKINSYTQPVENILLYQPWLVKIHNQWHAMTPWQGKQHGKSVVAQFEGSHDRNAAASFTHAEIAVYREQLPELEEDEYYWNDLIGLTVVNHRQATLGQVDSLMATGANDVLVVKGEKIYFIPYLTGQVVKKVDLHAGILHVSWDVEADT